MNRTGRIKRYERLNQKNDFLEKYQNIMIHRMNLNHEGRYNRGEVERLIRNETNQPNGSMNTSISGGLKFLCDLEPEFYLMLQETIKKMTGSHVPMNEFVHLLLGYFQHAYGGKHVKKTMPFNRKFPNRRLETLKRFQGRFRRFYKNRFASLE